MDTDKVQVVLTSLDRAHEQRAFDLKVLALWAHATTATGKTSDEIKSFTFRPEHLTPEESKRNRRMAYSNKPPVYCSKNWHNCVRLVTGDLVGMPGIKRPTPPEWLASEARKVTTLI